MPKIPLSWLAEYVELGADANAQQVAKALVSVGLEEESIQGPKVTGPLVIGRVLDLVKEEQKNGKIINWCRVDVGAQHNEALDDPKDPQPGQEVPSRGIICGAHNFEAGDLVVVSLPGTVLPGPFEISGRKTYGHFSDGMICSTEELGLGEDPSGGIIVLGRGIASDLIAEPGDDAIKLFGLADEVVEINVTPDRGYCFSLRGVAREYSHATANRFEDPALAIEVPSPKGQDIEVILKDLNPIRNNLGTLEYVAQLVSELEVNTPTPTWMQQRLILAGMRPISISVDIANYVMLELGQPLHTFDADKVFAPIVVRRALPGETIVTLDEKERTLDPEDLVIADSPKEPGSRAIAIAGVMGGLNTEVDENTKRILIESANFDSVSIARTARRHKLPSEASKRFERKVDPKLTQIAALRAAKLLEEYARAVISPNRTVTTAVAFAQQVIEMDLAFPAKLIGYEFSKEQIISSLEMIGCEVDFQENLKVKIPSWRPDLTIKEALVEEIARLVGYEVIPAVLPSAPGGRGLSKAQRLRRQVANALAEAGANEVISFPFTSEKNLAQLRLTPPPSGQVKLLNPLSDDEPLMRPNLLATLLPVAKRNISRGEDAIAIFEIGSTFTEGGKIAPIPAATNRPSEEELAAVEAALPLQARSLALVAGGELSPGSILGAQRKFDWADALSFVKRAAQAAGTEIVIKQGEFQTLHPGRTAAIQTKEGELIGFAGQLHPGVIKAFSLPEGSIALEINLDKLISGSEQIVQAKPVSTLPLAKEDFAFVVDIDTPAQEVRSALDLAFGELAESIRLFDDYRGDQLPSGKKSLAFAVRLRPQEQTFTPAQIDLIRQKAIETVAQKVGAELRA